MNDIKGIIEDKVIQLKRFLRSFRFYIRCVGLKNALFVELPGFIDLAKEDPCCDSLFEDVIEWMEDSEEAYLG